MLEYIGEFSGKDRGYSIAYPELENVLYKVYRANDKEYGLPVKSTLDINELIKGD